MKLTVLTLPDDPGHWAGWLDQQSVGLTLRELVSELNVLHQLPDQPTVM